jgi:predicted O-linked N-acetylglucosamine transferase (SPINDLY family)
MDGLHPSPGAEAALDLAFAHHRAGRLAEAVTFYRRVLAEEPDNCRALRPLGDALHGRGDHAAALLAYGAALEIEPQDLAARINMANTLIAAGRFAEAAAASNRVLENKPDCAPALSNLGQARLKSGRALAAARAFEKLVSVAPGDGRALNDLGVARQWAGDLEGAIDAFRRALAIDPAAILAERNLLIAVLDCPDLSSGELFAIHRELAARHHRPGARGRTFPGRDRWAGRRLRLGYVSSDFRDHPVGRNIEPLLANHDRAGFEIFLYGTEAEADGLSPGFRSLADHWRAIDGVADGALARNIEADRIDILVLLAGRFNANRPLLATYRAAPVQVSFHDCATSGLDEMDYWLSDGHLHPADTPERFSEELYRLPVFYQFPPPGNFPPPGPPPSEKNGYVTFGCFNKPEKINHLVIEIWCRLLDAVPGSRLSFKYRDFWGDGELAQSMRARFARLGIEPERLVMAGGDQARESHLALYRGIDIALDPFPFNGATTTFEALAMGVPVIALRGRHFVDRVGATLLVQAGLGELAADGPGEYVARARDLATAPGRLARLRAGLRARLIASPLCDGPAYARSVEAAFRQMWRRARATRPPSLS